MDNEVMTDIENEFMDLLNRYRVNEIELIDVAVFLIDSSLMNQKLCNKAKTILKESHSKKRGRPKKISDKEVLLRKIAGYTQIQIAHDLGISLSSVCRIWKKSNLEIQIREELKNGRDD